MIFLCFISYLTRLDTLRKSNSLGCKYVPSPNGAIQNWPCPLTTQKQGGLSQTRYILSKAWLAETETKCNKKIWYSCLSCISALSCWKMQRRYANPLQQQIPQPRSRRVRAGRPGTGSVGWACFLYHWLLLRWWREVMEVCYEILGTFFQHKSTFADLLESNCKMWKPLVLLVLF